jgi:ADP-ribose pyrophosphatase YjhB (NUDIX family)
MSSIEIKKYLSANNTQVTIACGPVIIKDGKVLLAKNESDPFWKIPGGTLLDNESPKETVVREAKEETGLDVVVEGEPFLYPFHMVDEKTNEVKYFILFHYKVRIVNKSELQSESNAELEYFSLENLPKEIAPNVRSTIEFFLK